MAGYCTEAVHVLGRMISGEKEQAYQDDLKFKNVTFQTKLGEFVGGLRPSESELSEYLEIISSPRKRDGGSSQDPPVSNLFLKKSGDSFSAL